MLTASAGTLAMAAGLEAAADEEKMEMPWDWTAKHGLASHMQKIADPDKDDIAKFPRCPYCGMMRGKFSQSRHVVQYDDDRAEGTCSIHCLSISLALNMDAGPKRIWVGDAGADGEIKPLVDADKAFYAIQPGVQGTMTMNRKWAYADKVKAEATGGTLTDFNGALKAAYVDMADDTIGIRKRRAEKQMKH